MLKSVKFALEPHHHDHHACTTRATKEHFQSVGLYFEHMFGSKTTVHRVPWGDTTCTVAAPGTQPPKACVNSDKRSCFGVFEGPGVSLDLLELSFCTCL